MHSEISLASFARYLNRFGILQGMNIFFSNYFSKKKLVGVNIPGLQHPLFLRHDTSDVKCFNQVFLEQDYDFELDFQPKFIIDCGANIGLSSLFFQKKYPGAHIIAVEPEPSNFEMLLKNTKPYQNIECLNCGIWNKNVALKITEQSKGNDKWGFVVTETQEVTSDTINAITIAEIMKRFGEEKIDVLKMDIEGSELEVFSSNYEDWLPKTKIIMMELHDREKKGCGKAFFQSLFKYDFSINQYFKGEIVMCIQNE